MQPVHEVTAPTAISIEVGQPTWMNLPLDVVRERSRGYRGSLIRANLFLFAYQGDRVDPSSPRVHGMLDHKLNNKHVDDPHLRPRLLRNLSHPNDSQDGQQRARLPSQVLLAAHPLQHRTRICVGRDGATHARRARGVRNTFKRPNLLLWSRVLQVLGQKDPLCHLHDVRLVFNEDLQPVPHSLGALLVGTGRRSPGENVFLLTVFVSSTTLRLAQRIQTRMTLTSSLASWAEIAVPRVVVSSCE